MEFFVTIYNVVPIAFGTARVDDSDFGHSDGNGNGLVEAGETIEYVLALRNAGAPLLENVSAALRSEAPEIAFKPNYDTLRCPVGRGAVGGDRGERRTGAAGLGGSE